MHRAIVRVDVAIGIIVFQCWVIHKSDQPAETVTLDHGTSARSPTATAAIMLPHTFRVTKAAISRAARENRRRPPYRVGVLLMKFIASSVLPLPLYFATRGYGN